MLPKHNNWFCPLWQQELEVLIQPHCRWFSAKTCLGHRKHLSLILDFDSATPFVQVFVSHSEVVLVVFFGSLSSCNSSELEQHKTMVKLFSFKTFWSRAQFMVLLITASHPEAAKEPQTTTLIPPYLTQTRITFYECCVSFTLQFLGHG